MKNLIWSIGLAVVLVFTSVTAQASQCRQDNPEWFECETAQDCVLSSNACGYPDAVNSDFEEEASECHALEGAKISCAQIFLDPKDFRPECIGGECQDIEILAEQLKDSKKALNSKLEGFSFKLF